MCLCIHPILQSHLTRMSRMANFRNPNLLFLFFCLIWAAQGLQGVVASRTLAVLPYSNVGYQISTLERELLHLQDRSQGWRVKSDSRRRMLIGSVKPTCTYNECRGCRYKCRAEQVPVEGNDPVNSAYHYKCVCHR